MAGRPGRHLLGPGQPGLYLLATTQLGWTASQFQACPAGSLRRLLLPDPEP